MLIDNTNKVNIKVTRGDSLSFIFEIEDLKQDLSAAFFTCKQNADDKNPLFEKTLTNGISKIGDGKYLVRLSPGDTSLIEGKYPYDLQIVIGDEVYTLIKGYLDIDFDVTNGGN